MVKFEDTMSIEARREAVVEALKANRFVAITYAKKSGEVTTRVATIRERPETEAPKGVRETNQANFRYFECGATNRFDPAIPGDWKSFSLALAVGYEPAPVPTDWPE